MHSDESAYCSMVCTDWLDWTDNSLWHRELVHTAPRVAFTILILFINENIGRSPNNNIVDIQWHSGNFFPGFDNNETASNYKAKRQPSILWNRIILMKFSRYCSNRSITSRILRCSLTLPGSSFNPCIPSQTEWTAPIRFSPPTIVGSCHGRGMRSPYSINVLIPIEISYG